MNDFDRELEGVDFEDREELIAFYETNNLYFENYKSAQNPEKTAKLISISLIYCTYLIDLSYYEKGQLIVNNIDRIFNLLQNQNETTKKLEEDLNFLKGIILGHQYKYKESQKFISKLHEKDPDNFNYKTWFEHNKHHIEHGFINKLCWIGLALIIISIILNLEELLGFDIGLIGGLIIFVSLLAIKIKNKKFYGVNQKSKGDKSLNRVLIILGITITLSLLGKLVLVPKRVDQKNDIKININFKGDNSDPDLNKTIDLLQKKDVFISDLKNLKNVTVQPSKLEPYFYINLRNSITNELYCTYRVNIKNQATSKEIEEDKWIEIK